MTMHDREIPAPTRRRFEEIAEELAGAGVVASQMFAMPALKVGGGDGR